MRVVVDTNVLVSSFFGGPPRAVIERWKRGKIVLCVSSALIEKYVDVLDRLGVEANLVRELLDLFASGYNLAFTAFTSPLEVLKEDPDDNMLFECAVELKAKVIVTGDKKVRSIGRYMNVDVTTPAEFLERYGE
jgi:putative PIN family toxin of toxin-antitoxin system